MGRAACPMTSPIESKVVSRAIRSRPSRQVEAQNARSARTCSSTTTCSTASARSIYGDRRHILEGDDLTERIRRFLEDVVARGHRGATQRRATARTGTSSSSGPNCRRCTRSRSRSTRSSTEAGSTRPTSPDELLKKEILSRREARLRAPRRELGEPSHARARAPRRALGDRPPLARPPLRDGLPARTASACGRWPSAIRWSSTSARASPCSSR